MRAGNCRAVVDIEVEIESLRKLECLLTVREYWKKEEKRR